MADLFASGGGPPKDPVANLVFRVLVLARMARDKDFADNVEEICRQDAVFFAATFGWLFEPRTRHGAGGKMLPKEVPFVPWDHQTPMMRALENNLGREDVGVEKARGEGASWIAITEATRQWSLMEWKKISFVSKDEAAADRKGDADSLMWKVDFLVERMPRHFVGQPKTDYTRNYADHVLRNVRRNCAITAFAAVADVASGGRGDWFLMDELAKFPRPADVDAMASTQYVTDSRLVISTPKGASGAYYDAMHRPSNMVKIILAWQDNPSRNRGLYVFRNGRPEATDPVNNPLPANYDPPSQPVLDCFERLRSKGFKLEGTVRSPWYDRQCDRIGATPELIARELDRDYGGSETLALTHRFRDPAEATARPPYSIGEFAVKNDRAEGRFDLLDQGPLSLWMTLDETGKPPRGRYFLGCDIARGDAEYGSNSVICGINQMTREQVLEYVTAIMEPKELAALAVALARWLGNAVIGWEENGPGAPFGRSVLMEHQYTNVYEELRYDRKSRKRASKPGWWSSPASKENLFSEISSSVQREEVIVRSSEMLRESHQYVRKDGKIVHATAGSDPTHGDRVIGFGVCLLAMKSRPPVKGEAATAGPLVPGTVAYRLKIGDAMQEARRERDVWDDRSVVDLMGTDIDWAISRQEQLEDSLFPVS